MDLINNLGDLYLFVQVIDAGGFSAAATRMGTTRSLLSRRVIALEERLGARLLHRNARQFALTAAGERVYRHASAMCEAAIAAEQAAVAQDATSGLVRIEADGLLSPMLAELAPGFAAAHPRIRLAVSAGGHDVESLLRRHVDVLLSLRDTLPDSGDIVARSLGTVRMVTVGSPDLVRRVGTPDNPGALDDEHCLSYAGDGTGQWSFQGLVPRRRQGRMASADPGALLAAARAGVGFAQLPLYMVADDLGNGRLRTVLDDFEPSPRTLYALTLSSRAVSEVTVNFVRFIQRGVAAMGQRWERQRPAAARA